MSDSGQEKNHEPTERRKQEFADKGDFPKSRELTAAVSLLGALMGFVVAQGYQMETAAHLFNESLAVDPKTFEVRDTIDLGLVSIAGLAGPVLASVWAVTLGISLVQTRGILPKEGLALKWKKLNVIENTKQKFFSAQPLVELAKGCSVLALISAWVWVDRYEVMMLLTAANYQTPLGVASTLGDLMARLVLWALPVALFVALLDFAYQSFKTGERMRMTDREVKDEMKDSDGDPHVKAARKAMQRRILQQANVVAARTADVVIANPTHYAIALRYRKDEAPAPIVVARGVDHLALKIRSEARRAGVPVVENRLLARALYARAEAGRPIPEDLYVPVAEVLGMVLRRKQQRKQAA